MMDPGTMFPKGFHAVRQESYLSGDPITGPPRLRNAPFISRTLSDVKYYIIDMGHARRYPSGPDAPVPLTDGIQGNQNVPEMLSGASYSPFAADVYCIGLMFQMVIQVTFPPKSN